MYHRNLCDKGSRKAFCYGTVIFVPPVPVIDFGESKYPSVYQKNRVCPRVLVISTWTDAKYGLPGGGVNREEGIIDAMNREFLEEIGKEANFITEDFLYSYEAGNRITYHFVKKTDDLELFQSFLSSFHTQEREAYVNEVIGIAGYPVWIEGPLNSAEYSWNNNVWGFPRHLCFQGGTFTPTLNSSNLPRESIIILLLLSGVISIDLMRRVFDLSSLLCKHATPETYLSPLETFDEFLARVNIIL